MTEGTLKNTFLPPSMPDHLVVTPTLNRWGNRHRRGAVDNLLESVQHRLSDARLSYDSFILIADASTGPTIDEVRQDVLTRITNGVRNPTPVYILTQDGQSQVASEVVERTGLAVDVVNAILVETGYASQRQKSDVVAAATAMNRGKIRTVTFDDDTIILDRYGIYREEHLPKDFKRKPNSQVLVPDELADDRYLEFLPNSITSFFDHLGKTVRQIRERHPNMRATRNLHDTMNEALLEAADGKITQFEVTHNNEELPNSDDAVIVATSSSKFGNPDFRTINVARAHAIHEFPDQELHVQSVLSGPPEPFAFQFSSTNVDSAALARLFDEHNALYPWWFTSSDKISRQNPLQTVTGHYRSDNELLPILMGVISKAREEMCLYISGVECQVFHNRARSGYRPGLHEQATASLVGNIAATESAARMSIYNGGGRARMEPIEDSYEVPRDFAERVFDEIKSIAEICDVKMQEIRSRSAVSIQSSVHDAELLTKYQDVYRSIESKLAGFEFETFYKHLNVEIRDQMRFYEKILQAFPLVVEVVHDIIQAERYPVQQFTPSQQTQNAVSMPMATWSS